MIDQTSDAGFATLRTLADMFPQLEELAKTAELDPGEFETLPDSAFAWPEARRLPIHNREHTAISLAYEKVATELPKYAHHALQQAAVAYGLDAAVFDRPLRLVKTASTPEFWLLPSHQRFRVTSSEDVKLAEQALQARSKDLPPNERAEAMINLEKAATFFGVSLTPSTKKIAGFTLTNTRTLRDWLQARQEAAEKVGSDLSATYGELAQQFNGVNTHISNRDYQVKLASAIDALDQKSGVSKFYGKSLLDPIETVWNTSKLAADTIDVNGVMLDKSMLASLPITFWQDVIGPDMAQEIAPSGQVDPELLAQIIPTLPADLKSVLVTQLSAYRS